MIIDTLQLKKAKFYSIEDNQIWGCFIIQEDPDKNIALIYAPSSDGYTACYIICKKEEDSGLWIDQNEINWVNCGVKND